MLQQNALGFPFLVVLPCLCRPLFWFCQSLVIAVEYGLPSVCSVVLSLPCIFVVTHSLCTSSLDVCLQVVMDAVDILTGESLPGSFKLWSLGYLKMNASAVIPS